MSTAVSIGGDAIIGSAYAELMPLFEADEQTEAIVIYTEPGGRMEAQLAEWVAENDSRLPIVAFMAGRFMDDEAMKGMSFGHAGTIVEGKEDTATEKIARLEAAGIPVVERIDEIPDAVKAEAGREERGLMAGIFIDVEVSDEVRGDAELAKKLEEACPVDIFKADGGVEVVERQPRRVHPLRAVRGGRAARRRARGQALRRRRGARAPLTRWSPGSRGGLAPTASGSGACGLPIGCAPRGALGAIPTARGTGTSSTASPETPTATSPTPPSGNATSG